MKPLTKAQQIENVLVAQAMMKDIKASQLIPGLTSYANRDMIKATLTGEHRCGSAACFGGWVAVHPHFAKHGIVPNSEQGYPVFKKSHRGMGVDVSEYLFGDSTMFYPNDIEWVGPQLSDKAEINARLKRALRNLTTEEE